MIPLATPFPKVSLQQLRAQNVRLLLLLSQGIGTNTEGAGPGYWPGMIERPIERPSQADLLFWTTFAFRLSAGPSRAFYRSEWPQRGCSILPDLFSGLRRASRKKRDYGIGRTLQRPLSVTIWLLAAAELPTLLIALIVAEYASLLFCSSLTIFNYLIMYLIYFTYILKLVLRVSGMFTNLCLALPRWYQVFVIAITLYKPAL